MSLQDLLLSNARKSPMATPYSCVIVYRGSVIATGYNHYITPKCCGGGKQCLL